MIPKTSADRLAPIYRMRARNACELPKFNVLGVNAGISAIDESPRAPFGARSIYVQRRADFRVLPPCHGGWEIFQRQQQSRRKEGVQRDRAQMAVDGSELHV